MSKHTELQAEYRALSGKNPKIMSTEKLAKEVQKLKAQKTDITLDDIAKITSDVGRDKYTILKKTWDEMTEVERKAEAKRQNSRVVRFSDSKPVLIHIEGKPMAIVNNKYIPWKDAEIMWQEEVVQREISKLNYLKNGS